MEIAKSGGSDRLGLALASVKMREMVLGGLASWVDEKAFTSACLEAFGKPEFAKFDTAAKVRAVMRFAVLGLYPGPQDHAYVIPRGRNLDVMPGFRGFVYLARQLPGVQDITAHLVHTTDEFQVKPVGPDEYRVITHEYDPLPPAGGRWFRHPSEVKGELEKTGLRGAYVKLTMKDGAVRFHFVPLDTLMQNMNCAQTQRVYQQWFAQMMLKTAVRDAHARGFLHGSDEVERRMSLAAREDDLALGNDPDTVEAEESPVKRLEALLTADTVDEEELPDEWGVDPETGEDVWSGPAAAVPTECPGEEQSDLPL